MGKRLTKIYTRKGDDGSTGMADGTRVGKHQAVVEAIGDIDELNSQLGLLLSDISKMELHKQLSGIQHVLFDLGAELSLPDYLAVTSDQVMDLENLLDQLNSELQPLQEFILPGGSRAVALAHVARAVCRRAERSLVKLNQQRQINENALAFVNRLSDLLFVVARYIALQQGVAEIYWSKNKTTLKQE